MKYLQTECNFFFWQLICLISFILQAALKMIFFSIFTKYKVWSLSWWSWFVNPAGESWFKEKHMKLSDICWWKKYKMWTDLWPMAALVSLRTSFTVQVLNGEIENFHFHQDLSLTPGWTRHAISCCTLQRSSPLYKRQKIEERKIN